MSLAPCNARESDENVLTRNQIHQTKVASRGGRQGRIGSLGDARGEPAPRQTQARVHPPSGHRGWCHRGECRQGAVDWPQSAARVSVSPLRLRRGTQSCLEGGPAQDQTRAAHYPGGPRHAPENQVGSEVGYAAEGLCRRGASTLCTKTREV